MDSNVYRRVIMIKPIKHRKGKGLTEVERWSVDELAKRIKSKLLNGRTVIACAPTICGQEMAHVFSNELRAGMPIICNALKSVHPHHCESLNHQELVSMVGSLTTDNENVVLLTHINELENLELFSHWHKDNHLKMLPDESIPLRGGARIIDCHL